MKLLSFAIPCYNSAAYMEKCIKSCLAGGDDVEIIIVDDGSTKDDTLKIAKEYEAKYPNKSRLYIRRMVDMDRLLIQVLPMPQGCSLRL